MSGTALDHATLVVRGVRDVARGIRSYELAPPDGGALPPAEAGAHLVLHLPNGLARQYSLCDAAGARESYRIAVLREPGGRGGSTHMHDEVTEGAGLRVSGPLNNFPLAGDAADSLLVAGGIGITPIISMARTLHAQGKAFSLHYCAREPEAAAFLGEIGEAPFADSVTFHFDGGDPAKGLDARGLLAPVTAGRHLYCCGPAGLMDAVEEASAHWPRGTVHFERFKAAPAETGEDLPFTVRLARTGIELEVAGDKTVLQVLRDNGVEVATVCEEGLCGSCLTDVLEGEPDHRDRILTDEEKAANDVMAVCCSRAKTPLVVLDI